MGLEDQSKALFVLSTLSSRRSKTDDRHKVDGLPHEGRELTIEEGRGSSEVQEVFARPYWKIGRVALPVVDERENMQNELGWEGEEREGDDQLVILLLD